MKLRLLSRYLVLLMVILTSGLTTVQAQFPDTRDDVMFQGFWWDSYQDPTVSSEGGLYNFLKARAGQLKSTGIDVIWTPPPSQGAGMAYFPQQLFVYDNAHGSESQLRAMLTEFKAKGIHGMADIVVNHRNGTNAWADFTNPTWPCSVMVTNDEVNGVAGQVQPCSGELDEGEGFSGARDMNHKSSIVQSGYKTFLTNLKGLGFDSWRWDFTKGFPAKYVAEYNASSTPYFSVGEYFDANIGLLTNWVNGSGNRLTGTTNKSATFDFSLFYILDRAVKGSWSELNNGGKMPGLAGTFGFAEYAVTFCENHDAHNISGNDNIMKANAYILTHPGVPMIFAKHWLGNKQKINELVAVRKQNAINAYSSVVIDQSSSFYAAYIDNKVAVKVGPGNWTPAGSGWILNTFGIDYAVWSKINITTPTVIPEPYVGISMIGPAVGGWTIDIPMSTTDGITYRLYSRDFVTGPVKFRAGNSWTTNWGDSSLTNWKIGIGTQDGKNIPVVAGKYNVTFNVQTGAFEFGNPTVAPPNNFVKLSLQGVATGNQIVPLTTTDGFNYSLLNYQFAAGGVKFRDSAGTSTWGTNSFPFGNATLNGASIPVTAGVYSLKYNRVTGFFEFLSFDTSVSIIGSAIDGAATGWTKDVVMKSTDLGQNFTLDYTLLAGEIKFRKNKGWATNWGAATFPTGTGTQNGVNIPVPAGTYTISFNATTGVYNFQLKLPPTILSFTPTSAATGANVTIKGTNFSGASAVSFNNVNASSFFVQNDSTISAVVGSGSTGKVRVTTPLGTATSVGNFTYLVSPTISSFTPATAATGTVVTITGTNFTGVNAVSFGGVAASSFTVVNSTTITATVGSGASGSVSVSSPSGSATSPNFTFCNPVTLQGVSAGTTLLCFGRTTTVSATGVSGTNALVSWYTAANGGGTLLGTGTSLSGRGAGTYFARVTGSCGSAVENSITIVGDTVKPTITCPSSISVKNGGGCSMSVTIPNPQFSDNCQIRSISWKITGKTILASPATGINFVGTRIFKNGTSTVTYTIKDSANNFSTCSFTVKVTDSVKPTFQSFVSTFRDTTLVGCNKMVKFPVVNFRDNCGTPTLSWILTGANTGSGTGIIDSMLLKVGITNVKYTIKDSANNSTIATLTITLIERVLPNITCPSTITTSINTCSTSVVNPNPIYSDNCNIQSLVWSTTGATVLNSPTTGIRFVGTQTFNAGTTSVKYTIKDSSNNQRVCSYNVVVTSSATCFGTSPKGIAQPEAQTTSLTALLSPNPTTTNFRLFLKSNSQEVATVIVYSGDGKIVDQIKTNVNRAISLGDRYNSGTYLFQVVQGDNRISVKGIKR